MKDPAVLFYISDWLTSTAEMKADERGWFLNLILHQYDKGDLPDNLEELANLANVRFSEYSDFKAKWEQVLKQKFKHLPNGRLANDRMNEILRKRESFVEKRSSAGIIGYVVKYAKNELKFTLSQISFLKENMDFTNIDIKNKQMLEQVLKQMLKLYRNGNGNRNIDLNENTINISFDEVWNLYDKKAGEKSKLTKKWEALKDEERTLIMEYIPKYKASQPDKQYRKNFETFLNQKSWLDEIVGKTLPVAAVKEFTPKPSNYYHEHEYLADCKKHGILNPPDYNAN